MKKLVLVAVMAIGTEFLMSFTNSHNEKEKNIEVVVLSNFDEGWEDGYCEGWKSEKGDLAVCPPSPPSVPCTCDDTYKVGYRYRFKAGAKAARD